MGRELVRNVICQSFVLTPEACELSACEDFHSTSTSYRPLKSCHRRSQAVASSSSLGEIANDLKFEFSPNANGNVTTGSAPFRLVQKRHGVRY
jgi:hypothetical protein